MSLSKCLLDYKDALKDFDTETLDAAVQANLEQGMSQRDAELAAIEGKLGEIQTVEGGVRQAMVAEYRRLDPDGFNAASATIEEDVVDALFQDANPRVRMHYKEVTKRVPELTEAAVMVRDGDMTAEEYRALVEQYKPVSPYDTAPEANTDEEVKTALGSKSDKFGLPSSTLEEGHSVGIRLDIPSYTRHGVWTVTVHEATGSFSAGKVIGYESVALVNNAELGSHQAASLNVAAGKAKAPMAVFKGNWQKITPKAAKMMADRVLNDPAWSQVGFDPERHSYFYDRETMEPVVSADSVLQIGPLVLAKNAKNAPAEDFLFQSGQNPPRTISTRQPQAKSSWEDPLIDRLVVGLESFLSTSDVERTDNLLNQHREKNLSLMEKYAGFRKKVRAKTHEQRAEALIKHMQSNLEWLFDQVPEDIRERSTHWYVGARRIADDLATRYGVSTETVAGTLAALSPQKDWFMNVTQAERVLDIYHTHQNTVWDRKMSRRSNEIYENTLAEIKKDEKKGTNKAKARKNLKAWAALRDVVKGKKLSDLKHPLEKAMWIRLYDEVYYPNTYRIVSPEGYFQEEVTTDKGKPGKHAWGSNNEIAKAVSLIENDSFENINAQMGQGHKIRNFYNNILDPTGDAESVTIDTHAVAAAWLQPLAAKSTAVAHNFGSPAAASDIHGLQGTYALYAEAYRRAAESKGVMAREMQSITWEAVRGLYTAGYKNQAKNVSAIMNIWQRYTDGKIPLAKARKEATLHADEIQNPSWYGSDTRLDEGQSYTSLTGDLSGTGIPGRDPGGLDDGAGTTAAGRASERRLYQSESSVLGETQTSDRGVLSAAYDLGYGGWNADEARRWVTAYNQYGPEGMTLEARMDRARNMGFNVDKRYYHGTSANIYRFEEGNAPGIFVAPHPDIATKYAEDRAYWKENDEDIDDGTRANVVPVFIKEGRILRFKELSEDQELEQTIRQALEYNLIELGYDPRDADYLIPQWKAGDWDLIENHEAVQDTIKMLGYEGFSVEEDSYIDEDGREVMSENIGLYGQESVRSVHAAFLPEMEFSPWIMAQDQGQEDGARGGVDLYDPAGPIIKLGKKSDRSTILHELGHSFLHMEGILAEKFGVDETAQAVLDFLGAKSFEEIDLRKYGEAAREKHEKFAETFEVYLSEGKAPSRALRDAFVKFAQWITQAYKTLVGYGVELDDDTRQMFDRLLATQEEIDQIRKEPPYKGLFPQKDEKFFTDEQWAAYRAQVSKRDNHSAGEVFIKAIRQWKAQRTKEWKAERKPLQDKAFEELSGKRVYKAIESMRADKVDSAKMAPFLAGNKVGRGKFLSMIVKEGGRDPAEVAQELGYKSVATMVQQITRAPAQITAARDIAEEAMVEKYGDILNDGTVEREVRESMHSEEDAKVILHELRALNRRVKKSEALLPDAKQVQLDAKEYISRLHPNDINPTRFYRAEVRAAEKAGAAEDPNQAMEFKKEQMVNHYLFREATDAKRKHQTLVKRVIAMNERTWATTQVAAEFIDQIKSISNAYLKKGKSQREKELQAFRQWVNARVGDNMPVAIFDHNVAEMQVKAGLQGEELQAALEKPVHLPRLQNLSLERLQGLYDQLTHLRFIGGQIARGKNVELRNKSDALYEQAKALQAKRGEPHPLAENPNKGSIKSFVRGAQSTAWELPSLRNVVRVLDGGKNEGVFFEHLYRPIWRATNTQIDKSTEWTRQYNELLKKHDYYTINDNANTVQSTGLLELTNRQRVSLALYWGSESSRQALRDGWRTPSVREAIRDARRGKITQQEKNEILAKYEESFDLEVLRQLNMMPEEHLEFVNDIWAHQEEMGKEIFKHSLDSRGVVPVKVEALPYKIGNTEMSGGYHRLYYQDGIVKERLDEAGLQLEGGIKNGLLGSLIERVGSGGRKVDLNFDKYIVNIGEAAHSMAFDEVSKELGTIYNKEVRAQVRAAMGHGFELALFRSIQGLTTNKKERDVNETVASASRWIRNNMSNMYLAWGIRNIMQQFASSIPAAIATEGGPLSYGAAYNDFLNDWAGNAAFVNSMSSQMASRANFLTREQADIMQKMVKGGKIERKYIQMQKAGFTPHIWIDNAIAYPLWLRTYRQQLESHGDSEKAAINADEIVAETVGSGLDINVGKFYRSNESELKKLWGLFGSWFNSTVFQRAFKSVKVKDDTMTNYRRFEGLVMTPMLLMAASAFLINDWPEEDDEQSWMSWLASRTARFYGALIPGLGGILGQMEGFTPRTATSTVFGTFTRLLDDVTKQTPLTWEEGLYDVLTIVGHVVPAPGMSNITRPLQYLESRDKGYEQEIENVGDFVLEFYQALVEGSDKNK